ALIVPGVRWTRVPGGHAVRIPVGPDARRLEKALRARLCFGRPLLVHDHGTEPGSEVSFAPSKDFTIDEANARRLAIAMPARFLDHLRFDGPPPALSWKFVRKD